MTAVLWLCYLERFCSVEFVDEVEERVRLPEKQQVAPQAVSSHCERNRQQPRSEREKPRRTDRLEFIVEEKKDAATTRRQTRGRH